MLLGFLGGFECGAPMLILVFVGLLDFLTFILIWVGRMRRVEKF